MDELKPCPFCGIKGIQYVATYKEIPLLPSWVFIVVCPTTDGGCGASSMHTITADDAIKSWNTRYQE